MCRRLDPDRLGANDNPGYKPFGLYINLENHVPESIGVIPHSKMQEQLHLFDGIHLHGSIDSSSTFTKQDQYYHVQQYSRVNVYKYNGGSQIYHG